MSPELWFSIGAIIGLLTIVISIPLTLVVFDYDEPAFGAFVCVVIGLVTIGLWPITIAAGFGLAIAMWWSQRQNGRSLF